MSKVLYNKSLPIGEFTTYDSRPSLENIVSCHQIHSSIITENLGQTELKADGIFAAYEDAKNKAFAIKTADCMPIIILGKEAMVFLHAGWRGLADGILEQRKVKEIQPFYAFIGPSICASSFEVTEEFKEHFPHSSHFQKQEDKFFFDLQAEARDRLVQQYPSIEVVFSQECTLRVNKYNSHRRNQTPERNWNIWTL